MPELDGQVIGDRIASVYTEMNATSKGVSLGLFDESKKRDHEGGSVQPFVELMGRRCAWPALLSANPPKPG